ncbi:hypothetical protein DL768_004507 [Monosporascus sp. mg162]|nr:hypothetical protein DL768_004507 [Monosporascus sp. mg162]
MPGDVRNPRDLWNILMNKTIANTAKVPRSRFNIDAYLHPSNERPGSFNVPGGYYLEEDLIAFDPGMFGISPIEAMWMDPQQRKLLEVVHEAFESSGTTLEKVSKQITGCFVGSFSSDFQQMANKEPDFRHAYVSTGVDAGIIGNRVSYIFDLKGPSLMVNTACSSSLFALDLACKAMASGECDSAIVGGTNLIFTVDQHMNTAKMGVLSPTNQCHTFDKAADGYGRAEGVGALYLKPLGLAMQNGDPIRAVIRSTATNSSGKCKDGMTHPSLEGQIAAISLAYAAAGIKPNETSYVECHGTGTPVGDPIEVKAIHQAMGISRSRDAPVLIGSIKPNIGHSEAASSMATLIKAVLALENGVIPPTAGVTTLNPEIPWDEINVEVATESVPFPASMPIRRIGVSAFGYGGTNAHAILESTQSIIPDYRQHTFMHSPDAILHVTSPDTVGLDRGHLLLFSAHDEPTLKNNLHDHASQCDDINILNLAYTLGHRRNKFPCRTFAIGKTGSLASDIHAATTEIIAKPTEPAKLAFVFTGQGAQWPCMGEHLLRVFPSVLQTIRHLDQCLSSLPVPPSWKIETILTAPERQHLVNEPEFSQPLCTAIQIALVDLMTRWEVRPLATIGHSSGEIGAAYAAGRISARAAIAAAYFRGKVAASLRTDGAMLAVGLGADEALRYIRDLRVEDRVVLACHNSPTNTTLSGDREPLELLKDIFDSKKIFARMLKTGGKAYHSHHMKEAAARYLEYLRDEKQATTSSLPKVAMFLTVETMQLTSPEKDISDSYWADNLKNPVLFHQGVELMLREIPNINLLVEVGPHPALAGPLRQTFEAINKQSIVYQPTLKRGELSGNQLLRLAGNIWARDGPIDVRAVTGIESMAGDGTIDTNEGTFLVDLPPYHWTYTKIHWAESRLSMEHRGMTEARHDILGRRLIGASSLEPIWRNVLRQKDLPWLAQHRVGGEVILPASGYMALAAEALTQLNAQSDSPLTIHSYTIRDVIISVATVIPDDDLGTETLFRLYPTSEKVEMSNDNKASQWYQFNASCYSYGAWNQTARGKIALNLIAHDGCLLADFIGCRTLLYNSAIPQEMSCSPQQDFYIKTEWKVDADYLRWAKEANAFAGVTLSSIVELMLHKDAGMRVLCLDDHFAESILADRPTASVAIAAPLEQLDCTDRRNMRPLELSATAPRITDMEGVFDLVIIPETSCIQPQMLNEIRKRMAKKGRLFLQRIDLAPKEWGEALASVGFSGIELMLPDDIIMTTVIEADMAINGVASPPSNKITLVYEDEPSSLLRIVSDRLVEHGWDVRSRPVHSLDQVAGEAVILLVDAERPFLANLTEENLRGLIRIVENASAIIWITCGGLLTGDRPEFGMTAGAARVIRNEQGSLDLVTLDFDIETTTEARVADLVADIVKRQHTKGRNGETEYYIKSGVVYIGRLVSHRDINREFVPDSGEMTVIPKADCPAIRGKMNDGTIIFHRDDDRVSRPLKVNEVEIDVAAMGLTASDGVDDRAFLNHQVVGTVTRVGSDIEDISPGMKVTGFTLGRLETFQRTSAHLLREIPPGYSMSDAASLTSALATAIYGLEQLAKVQPGDSVVIVDNMGPVGLAAIQLVLALRGEPIVITTSPATESFLCNSGLLQSKYVIPSHDNDLSSRIHEATAGRGIDVLLCSTGSGGSFMVEESVRNMAPLGRIAAVGQGPGIGSGITNLTAHIEGLSYFYFDIADIIRWRPRDVARIGKIKPYSEPTTIKPEEINSAIQSIPTDIGSGQYVISYGEDTRWNLHVDTAAKTVRNLEASGVDVLVLRADVTQHKQLADAITKINPTFPIRGMVNAANVLHDSVFLNMSIDAWRRVADTKVNGCLNLHTVLKDEQLDFFVMTSSISSTLGSTGQSNYGAANSFLEALACHRRARGLPAVALILPAIFGIGYISEHPEVERSIKSKGMYGIRENEMLEAFEVAMTPQSLLPPGVDHIAVGIQPRRYGKAIKAAEAHIPWGEDPRLNWMAAAIKETEGLRGINPSLFQIVREEVAIVMTTESKTGKRTINSRKLVKLPLLLSTFTETLRLRFSSNITRDLKQPITLDEQVTPKGSTGADDGISLRGGRLEYYSEILLTIGFITSLFDMELVGWTKVDGSPSDRRFALLRSQSRAAGSRHAG